MLPLFCTRSSRGPVGALLCPPMCAFVAFDSFCRVTWQIYGTYSRSDLIACGMDRRAVMCVNARHRPPAARGCLSSQGFACCLCSHSDLIAFITLLVSCRVMSQRPVVIRNHSSVRHASGHVAPPAPAHTFTFECFPITLYVLCCRYFHRLLCSVAFVLCNFHRANVSGASQHFPP